jgi:hypothetical protein
MTRHNWTFRRDAWTVEWTLDTYFISCLSYVTVVFMRRLVCHLARISQRSLGHMASPSPNSITVPEGFTLHTENTSHILLPSNNEAFLNPVQEFNRDLSVAAIRVWSEELNKKKEERWRQVRERRQKNAGKVPAPDRKRPKLEDDVVQEG